MGFLDQLKGISTIPENKLHIIMGFPGSGKTTLAATYPKPMLYVQIGDDGGGIVMKNYSDSDIKYLLLENDDKGSVYVKLMSLLDELKASNGAGFKTVVEKDTYKIVRPLIFMTKEEIKDYDDKLGIKYAIDASNFKAKYTRNRYRKVVLPFLKEEDKNVHMHFLKFSKLLFEYDNYVEKETQNKRRNF